MDNKIQLEGTSLSTKITATQYIQHIIHNYQATHDECGETIAVLTEKIGKWIGAEIKKKEIMERYVTKQLKEIATSPYTAEPDYRAFGELFDYNDQQIYDLQKQCPTVQEFLEYYAAQDAKQIADVISKLQEIKGLYQEIQTYCNYMLSNTNNWSTVAGATLAHNGLEHFTKSKIQTINKIGKEVMELSTKYERRASLERIKTNPIVTIDASMLDRSSN